MKKIVLFEGDIETQGYFSLQLAKAFEKLGHEVFVYDLEKPWEHSAKLLRFLERGNTVAVAFNFHGISGEVQFIDEDGVLLWDAFEIPFYNIVVDHPMYYYELLSKRPKRYVQFSIDMEHSRFLSHYFPEVCQGGFLPLAGTSLYETGDYLPLKERPFDLVMTGNYASPSRFDKFKNRNGEEYALFYQGMIDELMADPEKNVIDVCTKHIRREIPEATHEDLKMTMPNISFIDLIVRHVLRRDVVKTLVDHGYQVHVCGGRWEELECDHKENLIMEGEMNSHSCLQAIAKSKISINVMPWFKEGAHDRIYNSMCNGAICLTDTNTYLRAFLQDGVNCMVYDPRVLKKMPDYVGRMLENLEKGQQIADAGFRLAMQSETWANRAKVLHDYMQRA